jgi:hypothetical protein
MYFYQESIFGTLNNVCFSRMYLLSAIWMSESLFLREFVQTFLCFFVSLLFCFFRFPSKIFIVEVVVSSLNFRYIIKLTNWRNVEISSAMKELFFKFCFDKKYSKTTKSTVENHFTLFNT